MLRTGFVHAQPDAIADCGSFAVPDSCPYAIAHSEPNIRGYAQPHAVAKSRPYTEVRTVPCKALSAEHARTFDVETGSDERTGVQAL
jgi:hypothetical protein